MGSENTPKHYIKDIILLAQLVVIIWLSYTLITLKVFEIEDAAAFGDSFGGINALFSGLAFAGLLYTIYLQREDLRVTKEEMRRATEAHQDIAEINKKQLDKSTEIERNRTKPILLYHGLQSFPYNDPPSFYIKGAIKENAFIILSLKIIKQPFPVNVIEIEKGPKEPTERGVNLAELIFSENYRGTCQELRNILVSEFSFIITFKDLSGNVYEQELTGIGSNPVQLEASYIP
ncbi:MAG: hypothetical protein JXR07_20685 [Reichenbachiella sp.]